jgi:hypothetical protein
MRLVHAFIAMSSLAAGFPAAAASQEYAACTGSCITSEDTCMSSAEAQLDTELRGCHEEFLANIPLTCRPAGWETIDAFADLAHDCIVDGFNGDWGDVLDNCVLVGWKCALQWSWARDQYQICGDVKVSDFNTRRQRCKINKTKCYDACVQAEVARQEQTPKDPYATSPIIVDLDGGLLRLTGADDGVTFDINADGIPDRIAWTEAGAGEAFLVLDRNENGLIDDGRELFGTATPQVERPGVERNGFEALRAYDEAGDGIISRSDGLFERLQLWRDANADGVSQQDELSPLAGSGIVAVLLDYKTISRRDAKGNQYRWMSGVEASHGRVKIYDVVLAGELGR